MAKSKTKKSATRTQATVKSGDACSSAKPAGVIKRKHARAGGKHALAKRLEAESASNQRQTAKVKSKEQRNRKSNATILGAVDGMKASLEELLNASESAHRSNANQLSAHPTSTMTSRRRQKLVAEESLHMQQVLQHPAFVADPLATLQEHLKNTMAALHAKSKQAQSRH